MIEQSLQEVASRLQECRTRNPFAYDVYNTSLEVWHVPMPAQRNCFRQGYTFAERPTRDQERIWIANWEQARVLELRLQSLLYFEAMPVAYLHQRWRRLKQLAAGIENWAESDLLSGLIAKVREYDSDTVMPVLYQWNTSKQFWLRRQSLVSLFYYQRHRKIQPLVDDVFALLQPLLADREHYVQKGVGWTLREAVQVYPQHTLAFIDQYCEQLSSTAFTTVMEKTPAAEKQAFKQRRQRRRLPV
jgi:3-methyladenine DNA glycosylase AlkD